MRDLVRAREDLARMSPGGSAERPIHVDSASVVEGRTRALACPACETGEFRIVEHASVASGLRRVDVRCRQCSTPRSLWFRLDTAEPN
jgi:predicted Zn finger-like uncharacterized protein